MQHVVKALLKKNAGEAVPKLTRTLQGPLSPNVGKYKPKPRKIKGRLDPVQNEANQIDYVNTKGNRKSGSLNFGFFSICTALGLVSPIFSSFAGNVIVIFSVYHILPSCLFKYFFTVCLIRWIIFKLFLPKVWINPRPYYFCLICIHFF